MTLGLAQNEWETIIEKEEELNEALLTKLKTLWASKPGPASQTKMLVAACRWLLHEDEPPMPPATACRGLPTGSDARVHQKMDVIRAGGLVAEVKASFQSVVRFPNRCHPEMGVRRQWAAVSVEAAGGGGGTEPEPQVQVGQPRDEPPTDSEVALLLDGAEQMRKQSEAQGTYQCRLAELSSGFSPA